jgi:adenylate kinase
MVIEFFGLPGSGKSTLYRYLLESKEVGLNFSGNNNGSRLLSKRLSLLLGFLNPISMINFVRYMNMVVKISGFSDMLYKIKTYSLYWIFRDRGYYRKGKNDQDTFVLYSQNIFNMILSVLHLKENVDDRQVQKMVRFFLPDTNNFILVITKLDIETLAARISGRPTSNSRFDSYHDEELITNLYRLNHNFELLKKIIYKNNIKVIELDMRNTVEKNAALIYQYLDKQTRNDNA